MAAILHKVKRGETIMSICLAYGLPHHKFVHLNYKFLGVDYNIEEFDKATIAVVIGDSADPLDLVRVIGRISR